MKNRKTLGIDADVAETAALSLADEQATGRIFASLDCDADEKDRRRIMRNALLRLNRNDRNFARAVLGGATARSLNMDRKRFSDKMKKIEKFFKTPVNIGRKARPMR